MGRGKERWAIVRGTMTGHGFGAATLNNQNLSLVTLQITVVSRKCKLKTQV